MHPNNSDQVARGEGISRAVRDALADPIGQSLPKKIRVEQATIWLFAARDCGRPSGIQPRINPDEIASGRMIGDAREGGAAHCRQGRCRGRVRGQLATLVQQ